MSRTAILLVLIFAATGGISATAQDQVTPPGYSPIVPSTKGDKKVERRPYIWHNGRWWFQTADKHWIYWSRDHWEAFDFPQPTFKRKPAPYFTAGPHMGYTVGYEGQIYLRGSDSLTPLD
jgi:hypothetical protein